ncbi:MAG TPA: hypothetical protein VGD80_38610, partial [Kofleriaceae bacterium]
VAVPFLATALTAASVAAARPRGAVVIGPRNQPARSVFADAGFAPDGDGGYVLRGAADLARADPSIYRVACAREGRP